MLSKMKNFKGQRDRKVKKLRAKNHTPGINKNLMLLRSDTIVLNYKYGSKGIFLGKRSLNTPSVIHRKKKF